MLATSLEGLRDRALLCFVSLAVEAGIRREGAIFRAYGRIGSGLPTFLAPWRRRALGDLGRIAPLGFITEAGKQKVPLPAMMAIMTEHRSVLSVIGYFKADQTKDNPARLLK